MDGARRLGFIRPFLLLRSVHSVCCKHTVPCAIINLEFTFGRMPPSLPVPSILASLPPSLVFSH